jgi:hypothetical protein
MGAARVQGGVFYTSKSGNVSPQADTWCGVDVVWMACDWQGGWAAAALAACWCVCPAHMCVGCMSEWFSRCRHMVVSLFWRHREASMLLLEGHWLARIAWGPKVWSQHNPC